MGRKTKGLVTVIIAVLLLGIVFHISPYSTKAQAPYTSDWWNDDWFCRKLIEIHSNNPDYPQGYASYQYTFVLVKQDGYDGGTFGSNNLTEIDCDGNCQSDFGDVIFLDRNNNPIPFYIQGIYNDSGVNFAIVTVRITMDCYYNNSVGYIWMYYAYNGTSSTTSSAQDTYFVYEDFEDGSLYDDYNWQTSGDGLWYISGAWSAPDVNQNLHGMSPYFSGGTDQYARLYLDFTNYIDNEYDKIPIRIDMWATAQADESAGSKLILASSEEIENITGVENDIYWNNYTLYDTGGSQFIDILFYHSGLSSFSQEAGAVDNIVVRSDFTPAPSINTIYPPETSIMTYTMYPPANSTNIPVNNSGVLVSLDVNNALNHPMNITFYAYNYTNQSFDEIQTLTSVYSGNHSIYIPPEYCDNYTVNWYAYMYDTIYGIGTYTNVSYFSLLLPSISNPSPPSGSVNLTTLPITLSVNVSCDENVTVEWYYYNFSTSSFTLFDTNTSSSPGIFSQNFTNFDGNPVNWYVNVTGDVTNITVPSQVYNFTMKPPVISNESPPSGSTNVSVNASGVNTSINVSSYENMDITWYYYEWNVTGTENENITSGSWVEYGNETNVSNGSYYKFYPYDYINNTSFLYYYWMVKVVGVETNTTSYEVYNFTVEPPYIINPYPADGATNVTFTNQGVNTSVQINTTSNIDLKFYWYNWTDGNGTWEEYASFDNITGNARYSAYNQNFSYSNMLCYWNVTAYINGTGSILNIAIYNFTTVNNTMNVTLVSPIGNVSVVSGGVNTSITVNHTMGRNVDITWYWFNYTGDITNLSDWSIYAVDTDVPSNHTYYHQNPNFTIGNTTFTWAVSVEESGGGYTYLFKQFIFNTTDAITLSSPSPASGSTNVTVSGNGVSTSITVNHLLNHTMDLEWYYSKWVKNDTGNWSANFTLYATTYNVSNGTYTEDMNIPFSGNTIYYWYVVARENVTNFNKSYIPYTYSSIFNFTTAEYFPVISMISPSYNDTVNITSSGVETTVYVSHPFADTADIKWYYYNWWNVSTIPDNISSDDENWVLYGENDNVPVNHSYSKWMNVARIGLIPYYWMVKVYLPGSPPTNYTNISMFYCNKSVSISNVTPEDNVDNIYIEGGGIVTGANFTQKGNLYLHIVWSYYNYTTENWIEYAEETVPSGYYSHRCDYFRYFNSTYYWKVNITEFEYIEKNSSYINAVPQCFRPIYYEFVYNFTTFHVNFSEEHPAQNSTNVVIENGTVRTYITISVNKTITISWFYYDYDTSEWIQYGVNESVGSGTYSQLLPTTRAGYTYAWRVEVWER